VTHDYRNAVETKASIQLPVDTLAAPGAGALTPRGIADVDAGAEKWRELGESSSFVAPGEQVIAIQYRQCSELVHGPVVPLGRHVDRTGGGLQLPCSKQEPWD
jgi:hypothetical protein